MNHAYAPDDPNRSGQGNCGVERMTTAEQGVNAAIQRAMERSAGRYARFLPIARVIALQSKYPRTKVGAVVVGTGTMEIRSTGWCGAPRGSKADEDDRVNDRDTKLMWSVHAEANAIAAAARMGTSLVGCTLIVTHLPCSSCAKLIVQAGITSVIAPKPEGRFALNWATDLAVTRAMFAECGVHLHEIDISEEVGSAAVA